MALEENLSVEEGNLNEVLLQIIIASKAIALDSALHKGLVRTNDKALLRNIRYALNLDDITMSEFAAAVKKYDSLPKGHIVRQKAPYDLVHSSYNDVVAYYEGIKSSKHLKAA